MWNVWGECVGQPSIANRRLKALHVGILFDVGQKFEIGLNACSDLPCLWRSPENGISDIVTIDHFDTIIGFPDEQASIAITIKSSPRSAPVPWVVND